MDKIFYKLSLITFILAFSFACKPAGEPTVSAFSSSQLVVYSTQNTNNSSTSQSSQLTAPVFTSVLESIPANSSDPFDMTLNWSISSTQSPVQKFILERCIGLGCTAWVSVNNNISPNTFSYVDNNLSNGNVYRYRIRALYAQGFSAWEYSPSLDSPTPPAPTDNSALDKVTTQSVVLNWFDNAKSEDHYEIYYNTCTDTTGGGCGCSPSIGPIILPANSTKYRISGLSGTVAGVGVTKFCAAIKAVNSSNLSSSGLTKNIDLVPYAPKPSYSIPQITTKKIVLQLNPNPSAIISGPNKNVSYYVIQRSDNGGATWNIIATLNAQSSSFSFIDEGLNPNTSYKYKVIPRLSYVYEGVNYDEDSSDILQTMTLTTHDIPNSVTDLAVSEISTDSVKLTWSDTNNTANNKQESGFEIERCEVSPPPSSGCNFTFLVNLPPDTTQYLDTTVSSGKTYQYRIRPWAEGDSSTPKVYANYSNVVSASVPQPLQPVKFLEVGRIAKNTTTKNYDIELRWTNPQTTENQVKIYFCEVENLRSVEPPVNCSSPSANWQFLDALLTSGRKKMTYVAQDLDPYKKYIFKVVAVQYQPGPPTTISQTSPPSFTPEVLTVSHARLPRIPNASSSKKINVAYRNNDKIFIGGQFDLLGP